MRSLRNAAALGPGAGAGIRGSARRARWILGAAVVGIAIAGGCARVMSPPGWVPDRTPPQLIGTRPEKLATVPSWRGPVVFRFDERISETGVNEQTAIVSPDTGRVSVSRHGTEIRVMPRAGWKPDRIYHVVLMPTIKDLFGNTRTAPVEVVFSTGPKIPPTTVAGFVTDRLTGKPLPAALVQAVHQPDSLIYTTVSDTAGFFALRYLPEGRYAIRAFDDRNHDRKLQFREPHGETLAELAPPRDTTLIPQMALLAGDSTPARFTRVDQVDSTTLRLAFDDYVDPTQAQTGATVFVWKLPDSTAVPAVGPLFQKQLEALRPRPTPPPDTGAAARARAAADSLAARNREGASAQDTTRLLPVQEMYVMLRQPLQPKTRYRVRVAGLANIAAIPGGGGTQTFETAAPPPTVAVDTTKGAKEGGGRPAARDTTGAKPPAPAPAPPRATPAQPRPAPPDTTRRVRPDTSAVPGRRR